MSLSATFTSAKNILAIILSLIMLPLTLFSSTQSFEAKNEDELELSFSVLSDCHVEGNNYKTFEVLSEILRDAKGGKNTDALVFLGDNTMNGQNIESTFFYGALKAVKPSDNILVAMGNHDVGNGEGDYEKLTKRFLNYNNAYLCANIDKPYYYRVIDGCYFIVLATEDSTVNSMYISEVQLEWLKDVLEEAKASNKPIFVFNHHPLEAVEGEDYTVLSELLNDYDNLIYFYGHTHIDFSQTSFSTVNGVDTVNLPRCTEHATEGYDCGIGAVVEVYEDEVIVRIRDFYDHEWKDDFEMSYPV